MNKFRTLGIATTALLTSLVLAGCGSDKPKPNTNIPTAPLTFITPDSPEGKALPILIGFPTPTYLESFPNYSKDIETDYRTFRDIFITFKRELAISLFQNPKLVLKPTVASAIYLYAYQCKNCADTIVSKYLQMSGPELEQYKALVAKPTTTTFDKVVFIDNYIANVFIKDRTPENTNHLDTMVKRVCGNFIYYAPKIPSVESLMPVASPNQTPEQKAKDLAYAEKLHKAFTLLNQRVIIGNSADLGYKCYIYGYIIPEVKVK